MVILLAVYPLLVAVGLYALDEALPVELINAISGSVLITAVLSLAILAAVLAAVYSSRKNTLLMSAWLFLFCGLFVLFLGSVIDPYLPGSESWTEELFSVGSFFPLLFFVLFIASPVRLLILPRRQRLIYIVGGILVLLAVFAAVFLPWLLVYEGPRLHSSTKHLLRLARPVLDTLLAEPLALLVLAVGLTSGSGPYLLIGVGLILFIPEDILDHFQLLRQLDSHGLLFNLISIASRLYLLNGALLAVFKRSAGQESAADSSAGGF
jgi:hypothetical protein